MRALLYHRAANMIFYHRAADDEPEAVRVQREMIGALLATSGWQLATDASADSSKAATASEVQT
jgi:hypothetical protein